MSGVDAAERLCGRLPAPADLLPEQHRLLRPQLSSLLSRILQSTALSSSYIASSPSPVLQQRKAAYYSLSLQQHHLSQSLASHPHLFPALTALYAQHDAIAALTGAEAVRLLGVSAEEVRRRGVCWGEAQLHQERELMRAMIADGLQAQLETVRSLCDDEEAEDRENGAAAAVCLSSSFQSLTSAPPACPSLPALLRPQTADRDVGEQQRQQQQTLLSAQLSLLSVQCALLSEHRLSVHAEHDSQLTRYLQQKLRTLTGKQRLMHGHAERQAVSGDDGAVWERLRAALQSRLVQLQAEVAAAERRRDRLTAMESGREGEEWRRLKVAWQAAQRSREEKRWALRQLA